MKIIYLKKIGEGIYKPEKLAEIQSITQVKGVKNAKGMLNKPKNFVLAARMADGTYHRVSSEVANILKKKKDMISKGVGLSGIANEISGVGMSPIQRFLIYDPKKDSEAYLLGEITEAIHKLADFVK